MGKSKELAELGQVVSQSGGNVGIGTDEPAWPISVQKSAITGWQYYAQEGITSFGAGIGSDAVYNTNYFGPNTAGVQVDNTTETQELRFVNRSPSGTVTFRTGASNPVERMKIDGSGRVTMPYQPSFMAISSATAGQGPAGNLVFGNVVVNVGNCYNASTGYFTAPISGTYQLSAHTLSRANSHAYTHFRINNANFVLCEDSDPSTGYRETSGTVIVQLAANDAVNIYSPYATYGSLYDWFCGHLLG